MRANAPQLPGGGMGAAGIDWCINSNPRLLRMVLAQKRWSGSCERSQIYCTICEKKKAKFVNADKVPLMHL